MKRGEGAKMTERERGVNEERRGSESERES